MTPAAPTSQPGSASGRTWFLLLLLLLLETALTQALQPPGATPAELLQDLMMRWARLAALGAPALLLGALAARRGGERLARLAARVQAALAWLCAPARAARITAAYLAALPLAAHTVAAGYDLVWTAAALFALAGSALALAAEYLAWRLRSGPLPRRTHVVGRLLHTALLLGLVFLVVPRVGAARPLLWPLLACAWLLVPVPRLRPRALTRATLLVAALLLAGGGLLLENQRPQLRRIHSAYRPASLGGYRLLRRLTDLDQDGSSGLFGLDCDDLDSERAPKLDDLPDDGVDQNCTGADASVARAKQRFGGAGPRAAWPPLAREGARPPDIVLVTVDAMRADLLGARGASPAMPRTAAWSRRCHRFDTARVNGNFTDLSLFSLFSGMLVRHFWTGSEVLTLKGDLASGRPSIPPTLAEVIKLRGYQTVATVALQRLQPYLTYGFDRGNKPGAAVGNRPTHRWTLTHARAQRAARDPKRPLFQWVHLMDVHAPYDGGTDLAAYARSAALLDGALASFLSELPASAVVVLTADHGEAFGEHGTREHGWVLFEEELRVPLVLCAPAEDTGPPRRVATPVGLVDVMPTLLDLARAAAPYPRHGESLARHLRDRAPLRSPWVVSEVFTRHANTQIALVSGRWKLYRDLDAEWEALFDLQADPGERREASGDHPEQAARMRALLGEILDQDLNAYRSFRMGQQDVRSSRR